MLAGLAGNSLASNVGGTSGGAVLSFPVGARAMAMGEAYTAMAQDSSSLYWNPAGLAILNQSEASFMYSQLMDDMSFQNASVAVPLENGGIGASLSYLSYGKIDGFDNAGNAAGEISAYSGVGTIGGGMFGEFWSAGVNLKAIQGKLADEKATGIASDLGVTLVYPKEVLGGTIRAASTIRNLGPGLKYISESDPLPREWRLGVSALEMLNKKLNLSMDYGRERDINGSFYMGAEYWALPFIALRTGYAGSHTEGNGMRAGLGLSIKDIAFNYAFSPNGDLGVTHRYELTMKFGTIRPTLTPEMRRMLRQAKIAMADGRYGEATMLLDSLIQMAPKYTYFRRLVKTAMAGYQAHEMMAKNNKNVDLGQYSKAKPTREDSVEMQDLEALLKLSEDSESASAMNIRAAEGR